AAEQAAECAAPDKHGEPGQLRDRNPHHEGARPLRRGPILAHNPYDSEGSPKVQYARPPRELRRFLSSLAGEPGGIEPVEPAPARVGVGELRRAGAQGAVRREGFGAAAYF